MSNFKECKCKYLYVKLKYSIPPNATGERGKEFYLCGYVDSNHVGDKKTRSYGSGFFVLFNTVIIQWLSKKYSAIEAYVFGAEFVDMNIVMENIRGIRYKLSMTEVPISGPSYIYGDNMSIIHNTQYHESTLRNNLKYICYHAVIESVVMGKSLTGHIGTNKNCANLATNLLYGGKRRFHVSNLLYDIYDDL